MLIFRSKYGHPVCFLLRLNKMCVLVHASFNLID